MLELHVTSGARAGHRARFDGDAVVIGRDPAADLWLDAAADRDASARHVELRRRDGAWHARDLGSTNGTFVNGRRLAGELRLRDGDRIACGADGPTLTVRLPTSASDDAPRRRRRVTAAALALATLALAAVLGGAAMQRRAEARVLAADRLRQAADSAHVLAARDVRTLERQLAASDSARRATRDGPTVATPAAASSGAPLAPSAAALDAASIARRNLRAVALVAVETADGAMSSGTAFGVSERGLLVTNRHVVSDAEGRPPRRIAVKYADTDRWLEARLVRAHPDADLATVQVVDDGRFPTIARVADAEPAVGSEIVVIGYPAGVEAPHERAFEDGVARAAVFRGLVSKVADGVVVIDAYAGRGSSGSPVLDAHGAVVGVVYGGPRDAGGRVALAASSVALRALLR